MYCIIFFNYNDMKVYIKRDISVLLGRSCMLDCVVYLGLGIRGVVACMSDCQKYLGRGIKGVAACLTA